MIMFVTGYRGYVTPDLGGGFGSSRLRSPGENHDETGDMLSTTGVDPCGGAE
jgi:hypothetical protein